MFHELPHPHNTNFPNCHILTVKQNDPSPSALSKNSTERGHSSPVSRHSVVSVFNTNWGFRIGGDTESNILYTTIRILQLTMARSCQNWPLRRPVPNVIMGWAVCLKRSGLSWYLKEQPLLYGLGYFLNTGTKEGRTIAAKIWKKNNGDKILAWE